ncbi:MAG: 50S ribosomal protein L24 [Patescibacteria group bacterium]|nr:50S ribosomal protein L24 [Patescibacteria group bacterium]
MKIKEDDNVLVQAGKDKGKKGKVMRVLVKQNKITVEKVNIRTKHIKKTQTRPGEIIKFEVPIDASNAMVICPSCGKPTRVGYIILENKKKQRVCKHCNQSLDSAKPKA